MTVEERKIVLFDFLREHGALDAWERNAANNNSSKWQSVESAFKSNDCYHCMGDVFEWCQTPEGSTYWEILYNKWCLKFKE